MKDNWFSRLVGFDESDGPDAVRSRLRVADEYLISSASARRTRCGRLELVSLGELRQRVAAHAPEGRPVRVSNIRGEARRLHQQPEHAGALIQVASQFNLLEMVGPDVTPDDGIGRYEQDRTQGPACAMAAGAATIYRNYLVPFKGDTEGARDAAGRSSGRSGGQNFGEESGQTRDRQLDGLADLGQALAAATGLPLASLWAMRNGYALCTKAGLDAIDATLARSDEAERDRLRGLLRIGVHQDIEVTDIVSDTAPLVSHALCSALPVAYSANPGHPGWAAFAQLVLEASYEATLLAGVLNARRGVSELVLLTCVGGGVFGNRDAWIEAAMRRAVTRCAGTGLDVRIVSYDAVPGWLKQMAIDLSR